MHDVELVLALLVGVAALASVSRVLRLPDPLVLVLGGLLLALTPAVPAVTLSPDLVFLFFLPPLLYVAAFNTSIRDVHALLQPIVSLAVGLVVVTTVVVAVVAHALVPDLGWPAAFALGAIVSPPDAVAAVAIFRRLSVPRRLVTILEGESLFNDATALVVYRAAVGAMAASFSLGETGVRFLVVGTGGVVVGLLIGAAVVWLRGHVNDPPVEITISLLTPFGAYLPAEWLHASGVLSTVTAGLVLGWNSPRIMASETRVQGRAVWDMMVFVLNGLVFILIGLQLSTILADLSLRALLVDAGFGLVISIAAILVRFGWVVLTVRAPGWIGVLLRGGAPPLPWPDVVVVGWAGMRGVVSLATALALPRSTPERDLILFATFCVILVTLVGQGISLPWLVRRLGITADGDTDYQEWRARTVSTDAAVARLAELAAEWPAHVPLIETLRGQYSQRTSHLDVHASAAAARDGDAGDAAAEQELLEHHLIRRAVIDAERAAVLDLRQRGEIADEVWRRVERDLDLEELRLEA